MILKYPLLVGVPSLPTKRFLEILWNGLPTFGADNISLGNLFSTDTELPGLDSLDLSRNFLGFLLRILHSFSPLSPISRGGGGREAPMQRPR